MNASKLAIPALCVGLLGVVGGVAASQAFKPAEKPAPVVNIAPAAETVTPTVAVVTPSATATTVAPAPVKSVKVAVPSTPKATTTSVSPKPVQRQAIVSEPTADPTPSTPNRGTVVTNSDGTRTVKITPGQAPPPIPPGPAPSSTAP